MRCDGSLSTVLDWSITPLVAPGVAQDGDVSLGVADLGSDYGEHALSLVDTAGRKVYRPLIEGKKINAVCVCAAYLGGTGDLRLGRTTLFQLAFPSLPGTLATVDVTDKRLRGPRGAADAGRRGADGGHAGGPRCPGDLGLFGRTRCGRPADGQLQIPPRSQRRQFQRQDAADDPRGRRPLQLPRRQHSGVDGHRPRCGRGTQPGWRPACHKYDLHVSGTGYKDTVSDGPGLVVGAAGAAAVTMRSNYATLRADTGVVPNATGPHWQQCLCSDWQRRETSLAASGGALTLATPFPALPRAQRPSA